MIDHGDGQYKMLCKDLANVYKYENKENDK